MVVLFSAKPLFAFDDLQEFWNVDVLYHYARSERTTLLRTDNFQSRQGLMLQVEYEDQIDLFWRWYAGGDFTFGVYEAASTIAFSPREQFPWQVFLGTGFQMGAVKNFEIFFGLGAASETLSNLVATNTFDFKTEVAARGHIGFSWRFFSVTGSTAKLLARYSTALTEIKQGNIAISQRGVLDATLRLRYSYDSLMSLYGGMRLEDYALADNSISYFNTRIYAGFGFHFN